MNMRRAARLVGGKVVVFALFLAVWAGKAGAVNYKVVRVASGLDQPTFMTQAPGDPANIIYYSTRITPGGTGATDMGGIWRYDMTTRTSTQILNLSSRELSLDGGLVGFAFSPDFNTMGSPGYQKLYVSTSTRQGTGLPPIDRVEEFLTTGPGGTVPVDGGGVPLVNRTILQYTHQNNTQNHTIDWIGFDPTTASLAVNSPERNYLYIVTGDGCNTCDSHLRPEQKPNAIEGKLLRVDVDVSHPDAYPAGDTFALTRNYAIPTTNPIPLYNAAHPGNTLTGTTLTYNTGASPVTYSGPFGEIYATGLRNSFGAGFDRQTGDWYAGDVGENAREEVNILRADAYDGNQPPQDYGYIQREGTIGGGFGSSPSTTLQWNRSAGGPVIIDSVNPIREGRHASFNLASTSGTDEIRSDGRSAYIGGYVYRGPIAELQGQYFYTDFVQGNVFSLDFDRDTPVASYSGGNFNLNADPAEGELGVAALGDREVVLNRNLNSLWQSLVVDPTDPSYTAANDGLQFGIGRVVNFGEDNAGNLYIIDFGGDRGNDDFGNDYPPADRGEIFMLVPAFDITVTVNRDTGQMTFSNATGEAIDIRGYRLSSGAGSINPDELMPVTNRLDAPPGGDGSIDPNNAWVVTSAVGDQIIFSEASTGTETTLSIDEEFTLSQADGWIQSIYEDLLLQFTLPDGTSALANVVYEGNGDQPFDRSDLNFNGVLDGPDWDIFRANHLESLAGLSLAEAYQQGDLDGDGDNDFFDFRIFQADYIAANGEAGFLALFGVPEPGTLVLMLASLTSLTFVRRRFRLPNRLETAPPRRGQRARCLVAVSAFVAPFVALSGDAHADLRNRYTFNDPAGATTNNVTVITDSVSGVNGIIKGNNGMFTGTGLSLPGGTHSSGNAYVDLPNNIFAVPSQLTDVSFEGWYTTNAASNWARIFDFGTMSVGGVGTEILNAGPLPGGAGGAVDTIFYAPSQGTNIDSQRYSAENDENAICSGCAGGPGTLGGNFNINTSANTTLGQEVHFVVTVVDDADGPGGSDQARHTLYINGVQLGSVLSNHKVHHIATLNSWLGKSNYNNDSQFNGILNEFRIYSNALTQADVIRNSTLGPDRTGGILELEVNTFTGEVTIVNDQPDLNFAFDYYRITTPNGTLSPSTWNSLDDQNVDADGSGVGQSWDEGGSPDENEVIELYMRGVSDVAGGGTRSLGQLFNPLVLGKRVADDDLVFEFALDGDAALQFGNINFITPPPLLGDYNDDGTVNAADYTVYRNRKAGIGGTTLTNDAGDPGVTFDDYVYWKAHYGETILGSGASVGGQQVPEPSTAVLLAAGLLASLWGDYGSRRLRSRA
jgi:glucose/arabinose dehydrogenase